MGCGESKTHGADSEDYEGNEEQQGLVGKDQDECDEPATPPEAAEEAPTGDKTPNGTLLQHVKIPSNDRDLIKDKVRVSPVTAKHVKVELTDSGDGTNTDSGEDPAARGAQMEDRFYNNKSFQKPGIDSNDPSQREAALKIQTKYRQFHAKQEVEAKRKEKAVVKIQAGFRGWEDRKKVDEMKKGSDGAAGSLDEEEVDIDLNDPEVAAAATKIQAGFKGHKARQEVKKRQEDKKAKEDKNPQQEEEVDIDLTDPVVQKAAAMIQGKFKFKLKKTTPPKKEAKPTPSPEEEIDIDLNDPDVAKAATKIQAGFRGLQTRKHLGTKREDEQPTPPVANEEEEEVDIDLEDPDVAKAALKIQAGFRGLQDRQKVKTMKDGQGQMVEAPQEVAAAANGQEEEVDIDLEDPEVAKAAEKIQAGFKGLKTRKQLRVQRDQPSSKGGNTD